MTTPDDIGLPPGVTLDDAELRWTDSGTPYVRTPDDCFDGLPGFDHEPHHAVVDGLRMHYVEAGPDDGPVILLLHGQPTWSYLYRRMIPILARSGLRVIAPDHIGMGRSDKPVRIEDYRYLRHVRWITQFLDALQLDDITLFVQDWGSLIGLRVLGDQPHRFTRLVVANGTLPVLPAGFHPITLPATLDPDPSIPLPFADPASVANRPWLDVFGQWAAHALVNPDFQPSNVLRHAVHVPLMNAELAAYDAPFPGRVYMAGVRAFPSLINTVSDEPTNEAARATLDTFERPTLTLFGRLDRNLGSDATQRQITDRVPGAAGQPHHVYPDAGHFVQEDVGEDIARRIASWVDTTSRQRSSPRDLGL